MEDNIRANTRKSRVPKEEQLKLINECRTSGMTDIDWCREHGIAVSTFYYWVKQLRKEATQIPAPAYGHSENPRPKQDVVPIDIVPERFPVQHTPYLDCFLYNKNTLKCRTQSSKLQREFPYYCRSILSDSSIMSKGKRSLNYC